MCVVSMIGDHYNKRIPVTYPWLPTPATNGTVTIPIVNPPSRQEFDQLKRDVEEMKELLKAAKQYDEEHDEPDCERDEKVETLRRIAELVGVDLEDVFGGTD